MNSKQLFLNYPFLLMAIVVGLAIGCGKDDANNPFVPLLSTIEVADISYTTAISGGNITDDRGYSVTERGVVWSTSPNPTVKLPTKTMDGTGGGTFTSKITSLKPGETYYVRAYATNSNGTGYGITLSFTAKNTETPGVATSIVSNITSNEATCGGIITSSGGDSIIARGVVWSTNPNPTVALSTKTVDGIGLGNFTSKITGLAANTTYYVRAYATNQVGTGYGEEIIFGTFGSFIDVRDGNVYKTAKIGNQVWMLENLKYLPSVVGSGTSSYTNPYYYVYEYEGTSVGAAKATDNYSTYGVLYNWSAGKNACPTGWHLPSDAEWRQLTDYLGGESVAGGKLKEAGTKHWVSPNTGATNEIGFTGLPGGFIILYSGFEDIGYSGCWWSSTEEGTEVAWIRYMRWENIFVHRISFPELAGLSVRCLKD